MAMNKSSLLCPKAGTIASASQPEVDRIVSKMITEDRRGVQVPYKTICTADAPVVIF